MSGVNKAVTIWRPTGGKGEFTNMSPLFLMDTNGNFIVDTNSSFIVDTGSVFTPEPVTLWAEDDSK